MDLKLKASQTAGKVGAFIDKRSPEILLGIGVISFVGSVATAVSSTLKVEKVLDDHIARLEKVKGVEADTELEDGTVYTEDTKKKVVALQYVRTGWEFTKLYTPTIIFTGVGLTCFLASFGILKKRNAALAVGLSTVRTAFDEYRSRVVRDLGKEMDEHLYYDTVEEIHEKEVVDENGKKKKVKEKVQVPTKGGIYDVIFDESCDDYSKDSYQSYLSLRSHLLTANTQLRRKGHLYYNRMLEEFRFDETDALEAGIIYDPDRPEESRFIQIKGFGTVRVARDGSLYIDDSTMTEYWISFMNGHNQSRWIQFENLADNIRDDVVRTDSDVRVIAGPKMD